MVARTAACQLQRREKARGRSRGGRHRSASVFRLPPCDTAREPHPTLQLVDQAHDQLVQRAAVFACVSLRAASFRPRQVQGVRERVPDGAVSWFSAEFCRHGLMGRSARSRSPNEERARLAVAGRYTCVPARASGPTGLQSRRPAMPEEGRRAPGGQFSTAVDPRPPASSSAWPLCRRSRPPGQHR